MFDHTKTNDTELLLLQAKALCEDENDFIANCANLSSLIYNNLDQLNWVGFYIYKDKDLVLGPFQGLSACTRIKLGKGVCGTSAQMMKTLNVPNVHDFEGHIACDNASNSEIVVPLVKNNLLIGVLDIDSPVHNRFDETLQQFFEEVVEILLNKSSF